MAHPHRNIFSVLIRLPFAVLFWLVVSIRHQLYAWKIFKQYEFQIPVICVGNLAVGGTGKTPHVQMLVHTLGAAGIKVAVLSRGYKRKSKGFLYVETNSTADRVGDEPLQTKKRFPNAVVAVCVNRVYGIQKLQQENPDLQVVILDDAFQYRTVKAGLSIVLTTYDNLLTKDYMLPLGTLRDTRHQLHRAEMVVVTKCPQNLKPIDFNVLGKDLKIRPYQHLYYTSYKYQTMRHLNTEKEVLLENKKVVALAGIAKPDAFFDNLKKHFTVVETFKFPDHHNFRKNDVRNLEQVVAQHPDCVIVTTEKDAMRLATTNMSSELKDKIYYQPIDVEFLNNGQESFNQKIFSYVRENKRIGHLY